MMRIMKLHTRKSIAMHIARASQLRLTRTALFFSFKRMVLRYSTSTNCKAHQY